MPTAKTNALDILKSIQSVNEASIKVSAQRQVEIFSKEVEPDDPDLIIPYEKDYVTGVELKTKNGKAMKTNFLEGALIDQRMNVSLVGPAGSGKSALAFHIVDMINKPTRIENQRIHAENIQFKAADKPLKPYLQLKYPKWHASCHEATRSEDLTASSKVMVENGIAKSDEILGAALSAYI
jgi:hypothetical protein